LSYASTGAIYTPAAKVIARKKLQNTTRHGPQTRQAPSYIATEKLCQDINCCLGKILPPADRASSPHPARGSTVALQHQ